MTSDPTSGASPPTTYGWDVVVASRISTLNAGLAPVLQTFDETVANPAGPVRAVGSVFGCTIAPGGSGALVNLALACPTLTLSTSQKSVSFKGGHFLVQARLAFSAIGRDGRQPLTAVVGGGAATVVAATFPETDFPAYNTYATKAAQQWLDRQTDLPYVFASCLPPGPPGGNLGETLRPVATSYAYADRNDGDGVLSVLSVVAGGTDPATLLPEVDPSLVAEHDAVAVISAEALTTIVGGLTTSIALTGSDGSIRPTGPMTLPWAQTGGT